MVGVVIARGGVEMPMGFAVVRDECDGEVRGIMCDETEVTGRAAGDVAAIAGDFTLEGEVQAPVIGKAVRGKRDTGSNLIRGPIVPERGGETERKERTGVGISAESIFGAGEFEKPVPVPCSVGEIVPKKDPRGHA